MTHTAENINHTAVTEFVGWFTGATNFGSGNNTAGTIDAVGSLVGTWWDGWVAISNDTWPNTTEDKKVYLKKGTAEYDAYVDAKAREFEFSQTHNTWLGVPSNRKAIRPRPGGWANDNHNNYNLMALPTNPMLYDVPWAQTQGKL